MFDPKNSLKTLLDLIPKLTDKEGTVVAVTSKLFSVLANCRVAKDELEWEELLKRESAGVFPAPQGCEHYCLTLKRGRLLANAGIDHSNSGSDGDDYLYLPHNLQQLTEELWREIGERNQISKFGVIVTDSGILPLRAGSIGVALAWCGIDAVFDYRGKTDLDSRLMEVSSINVIDSLATAATLVMGEGAEMTPIALITELDEHVRFTGSAPSREDLQKAKIDIQQDLYSTVISYDKMGTGQLADD